jgi:hypothetical protein
MSQAAERLTDAREAPRPHSPLGDDAIDPSAAYTAFLEHRMKELEPCHDLWTAVLALTAHDLAYLRDAPPNPARHERQRIGYILEAPPAAFLDSDWFTEICRALSLSPTKTRAWIEAPR